MEVIQTEIKGLVRLRPKVFRDERGFFLETWNRRKFNEAIGVPVEFVQDNFCRSVQGVLRGLHYQVSPAAEGKLVNVVYGKIFDVAVDLRGNSPTRYRWFGTILEADAHELLWIPEGFAHGFLVLSDFAGVAYKATNHYSPEHRRHIRWDDPAIGIQWPIVPGTAPILSAEDAVAPLL